MISWSNNCHRHITQMLLFLLYRRCLNETNIESKWNVSVDFITHTEPHPNMSWYTKQQTTREWKLHHNTTLQTHVFKALSEFTVKIFSLIDI